MKLTIPCLAFLIITAPIAFGANGTSYAVNPAFSWEQLPPVPDSHGFAGAIAGVDHNALILAGGSNFPDGMPWDGGVKTYYDKIFVLTKSSDGKYKWAEAGHLSRKMGYPASVSTEWGIVCIGGGDGQQCYKGVSLLTYDPVSGKVNDRQLVPLPYPAWFGAAAIADGIVYYIGGQRSISGGSTPDFLSFDLKSYMAGKKVSWVSLPYPPGPSRVLASIVVQGSDGNKGIYVASGRNLKDSNGKVSATFLKDAYRFDVSSGKWSTIASLPFSVCAASSIAYGKDGILIFGGDDGSLFNQTLKEAHPGFNRNIYYHSGKNDSWAIIGQMPVSQVTTSAVMWNGKIIIPNGEIKPGIRTPMVSSCAISGLDREGETCNK